MAESAASRVPAGELPFGVRAADSLLQNLVLIVSLIGGGGLLGCLIAVLLPRPYVDSAVVEVGIGFGGEPIENPIKAGWRIRGTLLDTAHDLDVDLDSVILHRREEKTNELTRFMDVSVRAQTASTARTILDRGLARLMTDHQTARRFEQEVLKEQLTALETAATRVDQAIRDTPPIVEGDPEKQEEMREQLDALNARLFDLHRSIQGARSTMSELRTPPTRVIARTAKVEKADSHLPILDPRRLRVRPVPRPRPGRRPPGAARGHAMSEGGDDPIVRTFLDVTHRYRTVIVSVTAFVAIVGTAVGAVMRTEYEGTVVVALGRIDPEGSIIDLHTADQQLESHAERLVVAEQLSEDTKLEAIILRDQPQSSRKLPLIALHATSPDAISVRRALDKSAAHLSSLEGQLYAAEHKRLEQTLKSLDGEVKRLLAEPVTPRTQEALQKAIQARADTKRSLSPVRTYPSSVLAVMPVEQVSRQPRVLAFGMLALTIGVFLGYLVAFLLAARAIVRADAAPRSA